MRTKLKAILKPFVKAILCWAFVILLLVFCSLVFLGYAQPVWRAMTYGILGTISAFFVVWVFLRGEHKSFREYGLIWEVQTVGRFAKGLLMGGLILGAILGILLVLPGAELVWNSEPIVSGVWLSLISLLPLSMMEEVTFRSYTLINLKNAYGIRTAQFVTALAFAGYHLLNGWTVYAAFGGTFVWAYVFGLAAMWSGGIAMANGLHVAVNAGQVLLGFSGSGAFWKVTDERSNGSILESYASMGPLIQGLVFVGAIICMEYYIKKNACASASTRLSPPSS